MCKMEFPARLHSAHPFYKVDGEMRHMKIKDNLILLLVGRPGMHTQHCKEGGGCEEWMVEKLVPRDGILHFNVIRKISHILPFSSSHGQVMQKSTKIQKMWIPFKASLRYGDGLLNSSFITGPSDSVVKEGFPLKGIFGGRARFWKTISKLAWA
jgi:hypothetical protein